MSYNGIGLTTPRGSGTNGYVQRNVRVLQQFARRHSDGLRTTLQLSHLRPRDDLRSASVKDADVRHRQADPEILEHERKRGVEVKCLELQMQLEELELPEDEVHSQVDALRSKLLAMGAPARERGSIKKHETHDLLAAKKAETANLGRALGISSDYKEGDAFDRELQAERAAAEKEAREAQKAERQAELEKRRKIQEEVEAIRREGQQRKQQRERDMPRGQSGGLHYGSRSPPRRRSPPPPRRRRQPSPQDRRERSLSPYSRRRQMSAREASRSPSPPPPRRRSRSPPPSRRPRAHSNSLSPPPARRRRVDSRSPPRRRPSSRSPPLPSPPPRDSVPATASRGRPRSPSPRRTSRSPSQGSAMSVSD